MSAVYYSYFCNGSNKAGNVSVSVTLTVLQRVEVTAAAYSGEEVAGIVIGALFICLLTFLAICIIVLKSKSQLLEQRRNQNGTSGNIVTATTATTAAGPAGHRNGGGGGGGGGVGSNGKDVASHQHALVITDGNNIGSNNITTANHVNATMLANGCCPANNTSGQPHHETAPPNSKLSNLLLTFNNNNGESSTTSATATATRMSNVMVNENVVTFDTLEKTRNDPGSSTMLTAAAVAANVMNIRENILALGEEQYELYNYVDYNHSSSAQHGASIMPMGKSDNNNSCTGNVAGRRVMFDKSLNSDRDRAIKLIQDNNNNNNHTYKARVEVGWAPGRGTDLGDNFVITNTNNTQLASDNQTIEGRRLNSAVAVARRPKNMATTNNYDTEYYDMSRSTEGFGQQQTAATASTNAAAGYVGTAHLYSYPVDDLNMMDITTTTTAYPSSTNINNVHYHHQQQQQHLYSQIADGTDDGAGLMWPPPKLDHHSTRGMMQTTTMMATTNMAMVRNENKRLISSSSSSSCSSQIPANNIIGTAHCIAGSNVSGQSIVGGGGGCRQLELPPPAASISAVDNVTRRLMTSIASTPSPSCFTSGQHPQHQQQHQQHPPAPCLKSSSGQHHLLNNFNGSGPINEMSKIKSVAAPTTTSAAMVVAVVDELKQRLASSASPKPVKRNLSSSHHAHQQHHKDVGGGGGGGGVGPVVRFSNSLAICSYSPNEDDHKIGVGHSSNNNINNINNDDIHQHHNNNNNHSRHMHAGILLPANAVDARDSPDEGLGEEAE